jgi:hypothetical protein
MTNTETALQTAAIVMQSAVEFMANKAGVGADEIARTILTDPQGNTARYFRQLLASWGERAA